MITSTRWFRGSQIRKNGRCKPKPGRENLFTMNTVNISASMVHQPSDVPLIVKLSNWTRENRQATRDLIGLFISSVATYFVFHAFNITDVVFSFTKKFETYQLDELIMVSGTIFSFYLAIFATRRWIESSNRLHQANTDSLTGLFNRRKGWEILEFEITRAKRYHRLLSIIQFDLDHFKGINDMHGHLAGDRILRLIAKTVLKQMRATDILIRWGGEEFIVVSLETDEAEARRVAERLRATIEACSLPNNIHLTGSFGITRLQENDTFDSLLWRVDDKVYQAKSSGRNKVV
jgi:diguanylate cyclase (GGDEF)-like protein